MHLKPSRLRKENGFQGVKIEGDLPPVSKPSSRGGPGNTFLWELHTLLGGWKTGGCVREMKSQLACVSTASAHLPPEVCWTLMWAKFSEFLPFLASHSHVVGLWVSG